MALPCLLLLDFGPENGPGVELRAILEGATRGGEKSFRVEAYRLTSRDAAPPARSGAARPLLAFFVLPAAECQSARRLFDAARRRAAGAPIVVVTGEIGPAETFELCKLGAADFIVPPLKAADVLPRAWRLLEATKPEKSSAQAIKERIGLRDFVGESTAFTAEVKKIPALARCDARILITGETGTGKELFARAIHYLSPRAGGPFVPVNCGAIPPELVENELFGHERGAYTGAASARQGLIREAEGGTLFLDEVACLTPLAQSKLLRFLQEKEYRPLGSSKTRRADVRVITATNVDLTQAVSDGRVRRDFYYRLNIIPLRLPPLRERRADIALLARHFLSKFADEFDLAVRRLSHGALEKLQVYDWPGNVRELEHVIERAALLASAEVIGADEIDLPAAEPGPRPDSFKEAKARAVDQFERQYLSDLLLAHHGNISQAALAAKKNRRAFWQLLRKHHIDVRDL